MHFFLFLQKLKKYFYTTNFRIQAKAETQELFMQNNNIYTKND